MTVCVSLILLGFGFSGAPAEEEVKTKLCGHYAVSLIGSFLEVDQAPSTWNRLLPRESAPFSLSELEAAAQKAGFDTLLLNWPDPMIADLDSPCILHVKATPYSAEPGHFVACFGSRGTLVCLGDYPSWPLFVARQQLCAHWAGTALHINRPGSTDMSRLRRRLWMAQARMLSGILLGVVFLACGWRLSQRFFHNSHSEAGHPRIGGNYQ